MTTQIHKFEEYKKLYQKSIDSPEKFWEEQAETFTWRKKWDNILSWDFSKPEVKWFEGGLLNITENCLDRHLKKRGKKIAIKWVANNPKEKNIDITYKELYHKVCKVSNMLKVNGAKKGDRICLYMPMG